MKARRAFLIIGSVILLLVIALVTLAVWFHREEEREKNRAKTAPARARKLEKVPGETTTPERPKESDESPAPEAAEEITPADAGIV